MTGRSIHDTRRLGRCATPCKFDHAMITCPESGEEVSNVARVVRVKVNSALPKPCATGVPQAVPVSACPHVWPRASLAAIGHPPRFCDPAPPVPARWMRASTTVTCRITPYMRNCRRVLPSKSARQTGLVLGGAGHLFTGLRESGGNADGPVDEIVHRRKTGCPLRTANKGEVLVTKKSQRLG